MKKIDVCVGTDRTRNLRVRLSLMYVDDESGLIVSEHYHSFNVSPGDDPVKIRQAIEQHISQPQDASGIPGSPWPAIPEDKWQEVLGHIKIAHKK